MFALSDARDYSFSKVPHLEREQEITDQSNFVKNVTKFSGSRARLKKWPTNGGKTPESRESFQRLKPRSYRNTEQDIAALPPGPNVTFENPLTSSQLLEVQSLQKTMPR